MSDIFTDFTSDPGETKSKDVRPEDFVSPHENPAAQEAAELAPKKEDPPAEKPSLMDVIHSWENREVRHLPKPFRSQFHHVCALLRNDILKAGL